MNKTESVSIGRRSFICEIDAYQILQEYLRRSEKALKNDPDQMDIMADLESSMASHLRELTGELVVDKSAAQKVVELMGEVEARDVEDDAKDEKAPLSESWKDRVEALWRKPLYKDHSREIIDGVCAGIAQNLKVDPLWVRLAFVLLTLFTSGFWILVYILLLVIMNEDTNSEKKTAGEVMSEIRTKIASSASEKSEKVERNLHGYERGLRTLARGVFGLFKFLTTLSLLLVFFALSVAWSTVMFFVVTNPSKIVLFGADPSWLDITALASVGGVVLIPIIVLIASLVGSSAFKNSRANLIVTSVWILLIIIANGSLINVVPNVRNRLLTEQPKTDVIFIEVENGRIVHHCVDLFGGCNSPAPVISETDLCGEKLKTIKTDENFNRMYNRSWKYQWEKLDYPVDKVQYCSFINKTKNSYGDKVVFVEQDLSEVDPLEEGIKTFGNTTIEVVNPDLAKRYWVAPYFTRVVY